MSGLIPEDIIHRVRDSVDVVGLVSRYLALKKAGANYKALCPFHKEKTPSFIVSPARQSFHCFGCGKGGNVIHFVMEMDRVSFPEAVRSLAKEAGIEIPDTRSRGAAEHAEEDERTALYDANRRAADFYVRMLNTSAGQPAREYLAGRRISDEMVERCRLGYSPDSWDSLLTAAGAAGVSPALLAKAGLAVERSDRSGHYDRFRNRLMFPIFDTQDRVIGFGARTMIDNEVKYLNTPETPIFSKGRGLYGLNWARKAIVDSKRVAVVEGYTDVIMAHQHGVENVVATLGTALTRENIYALRRFAERVDVVFDSDPAGQQAAERSMELFLDEGAGELVAAGFDVRITTFSGGKDPCDLIADQGPDAFRSAVDAAVGVFARKIEIASARHDLRTIEGKTKAADDVLALVALVPNAVGRELRVADVIKRLADALDMDSMALFGRLNQIERGRRPAGRGAEEPAPPRSPEDPAERGLLEALLLVPEAAEQVFARLRADDIEGASLRQVFEAAKTLYDEDGSVNVGRLLARLTDPEPAAVVSGIANSPPRPQLNESVHDCVRALLRRRSQKQIREVRRKLDEAKAQGNEALADDLSARYLDLQREVLAL